MTDSQKLDLLLGKMTSMESEMDELRMYLKEIVGENIRLRKLVETTDEDDRRAKLWEDIRRIAEGKEGYHFNANS